MQRPYVVFSKVNGDWRKGKGRYASVESAAKTAEYWIENGIVDDARVMERRADGVWATRWGFRPPIIEGK